MMTKYSTRLWVTALLLGLAIDFLFWRQFAGINFAIFTTLALIGGFSVLMVAGKKPAHKSLWLILPFLFFSIMTFIRKEPVSLFLSYVFTIFSMGVLAVTYLGGRWMEYGPLDYFERFLRLIESILAGPAIFIGKVRIEQKERIESGELSKQSRLTPIVRGILLALPIVAVFAALLASADLVFSQKISDFFELFKFENNAGHYIYRLVVVLIFTYVLTGVFLHASLKSQDERSIEDEKPAIKPFLGFTEAAIVLGSVAFLFLVFVVIQFQYFFGGNINIGVEGFTYSQYARRGFNELVTVAFFSLMMILGFSTIAKRENAFERNIYSGLSILIVALVMVILVSAYQRLSLAIDWHGFSRLRVYPSVFLIWVGILFITVVILEVLRRERYFSFAAVLAMIGFAVSLNLFNVDASIVRHNISRASQGRHFNPSYLATLSLDAVPTLADEFQNLLLSQPTREGIGAALLCHLHSDDMKNTPDDWRSFHVSTWKAKMVLDSLKLQLESYHVNTGRYPMRVRTPGNLLYECIGNEPNMTE